jgi:mono/diheme cytochrome c family protein
MPEWTTRLAAAGACFCCLLPLASCNVGGSGAGGDVETRSNAAAVALPVIVLDELPAFPLERHVESADIAAGAWDFPRLLEAGRLLFHTDFNGLDGVGIMKRGDGTPINRFAPVGPRGPGAQSCGACHGFPVPAAAGLAHTRISSEPDNDNAPPWNTRSVISALGNGAQQLLAQEMTEELQGTRDAAASEAKSAPGTTISRDLTTKGVHFGSLSATADATGEVRFDLSKIEGIDPDLVVRPFGWKGDTPTVRPFVSGPAFGGLGMQAEELLWKNPEAADVPDPDGDGVARELSVGDVTAMTIYTAAQETPGELETLAAAGFVAAPSAADVARIAKGRAAFQNIGCATCHTPEMRLENTVFEEPTLRGNGAFYDAALAARDPGYDPERPFRLDLMKDAEAPRLEPHPEGGAIVRLYGDMKRHRMGRRLAEPAGPSESGNAEAATLEIDGEKVMIPADEFLTAELWGVGNTGLWLHDGRAGTLREAILLHGEDAPPPAGDPGRSEAQESRDGFAALAGDDQSAVIAFLRSLIVVSTNDR